LHLKRTHRSTKTASIAAGLTECLRVGEHVPESSGMVAKAKILQIYMCMHLSLADSVSWEVLYCIVELLLSLLYVSLVLHDWNSLLCMGL